MRVLPLVAVSLLLVGGPAAAVIIPCEIIVCAISQWSFQNGTTTGFALLEGGFTVQVLTTSAGARIAGFGSTGTAPHFYMNEAAGSVGGAAAGGAGVAVATWQACPACPTTVHVGNAAVAPGQGGVFKASFEVPLDAPHVAHVTPDGLILLAHGTTVIATSSDGAILWTRSFYAPVTSIATTGSTLFVMEGSANAVDPDTGATLWNWPAGYDVLVANPVMLCGFDRPRGDLGCGTHGRPGAAGTSRWEVEVADLDVIAIHPKLPLVYVAGNSHVTAYDAASGEMVSTVSLSEGKPAAALATEGFVAVSYPGGRLWVLDAALTKGELREAPGARTPAPYLEYGLPGRQYVFPGTSHAGEAGGSRIPLP